MTVRRAPPPRRMPGFEAGVRRDRGRVIALGVALLALALAIVFLGSRLCGGGCTSVYCESNLNLAPPAGFEFESAIFVRNPAAPVQPPGTGARLTLDLAASTDDGRNLAVYRYDEAARDWELAAAAILDPRGKAVTALLPDTPAIIAVVRRLSAAGHVIGYLPAGAALHPDAAGRLTIVHTLDFRPTADGNIEGQPSQLTLDSGTAWYPVVSANAGAKTNVFVEAILASTVSRSNHVQQVQRRVNELGLAGIDLAYADLRADQRNSFTLLVAELAQSLHAAGKVLTLTLPCPIRAQDRIDEGAYDWGELAKAADVVKLSPCRDQGVYRRDTPAVLEHLVSVVPANKLVLVVTPYATEKSAEGLRTLNLAEAMSIALAVHIAQAEPVTTNSNVSVVGTNIDRTENLTGVIWDPATATVAFTYKQNGGRTIWLENFFSVGFKLEYVTRYGLGGVAVEDASDNLYLGNIWPAVIPFITSGRPILLQPNGADLLPRWRVSRGEVEEGAPGRGVVKWLTPSEPGTYTITLALSDGVALFENETEVIVEQRESRTPQATPGSGR